MLLLATKVFATHQRAGEISYRHISGFTYEITLITYTYRPSPADRPQLEINWGDGNTEIVNRTEIIDLSNLIRYNKYVAQHTYETASTYTISMEDPNRNGGVINIPGSVNIPFYVESKLVVNPFLGPNNSPVLLNPPLDNACVLQKYITNPGAYDIDGDSLVYSLVPCRGAGGQFIPGYTYPAASNGIFRIDPVTGDLFWDSPPLAGEYNLAILIEEYRNGLFIGSILRDMQVLVAPCANKPPVINTSNGYCVEANASLIFVVSAFDPNPGDSVTLTATGGPFMFEENPAIFTSATGMGSVSGVFSWTPNCSQLQKLPYYTYFKARDNSPEVALSDLKTVSIQVIAPPVQGVTAQRQPQGILIEWIPSDCGQIKGYEIFRRAGPWTEEPGDCITGMPTDWGFVNIASPLGANTNSWFDAETNGLIPGVEYCYRIVALLSDGTRSVVSQEACASLARKIPVITHVSIRNTDSQQGSLQLIWSKPPELDTILYPPPYEYHLFRGQGFQPQNLEPAGIRYSINDTIFTDTLINTLLHPFTYRVELISKANTEALSAGTSPPASSPFLSLQPGNNRVKVKVDTDVPWVINQYNIYRKDSPGGPFLSVGSSLIPSFTDNTALNDSSYCYVVESVGAYFAPGFAEPLINFSQISCITVKDTLPPCPPEVFIQTDCDLPANMLAWENSCDNDIASYQVYYSPVEKGNFSMIAQLDGSQLSYFHGPLPSVAGCYFVTATGTNGKTSPQTTVSCIDIDQCDLYRLPNVFTPDGDMINDLLTPFPYNFVESIDLTIFNRWGQVVFKTNNPDINWDGRHYKNNSEVSDGVYFYICDVFEIRLSGVQKRTLRGFVHIVRSINQIKN